MVAAGTTSRYVDAHGTPSASRYVATPGELPVLSTLTAKEQALVDAGVPLDVIRSWSLLPEAIRTRTIDQAVAMRGLDAKVQATPRAAAKAQPGLYTRPSCAPKAPDLVKSIQGRTTPAPQPTPAPAAPSRPATNPNGAPWAPDLVQAIQRTARTTKK
jgi:hypothetical protein